MPGIGHGEVCLECSAGVDMANRLGIQRREAIVEFIRQYTDSNGYPPSTRELESGCGLKSPGAMNYQLLILEREGKILRAPGKARTIRLSDVTIK